MTELDARIMAAGRVFADRLDAAILTDSLDYVGFGEARLAVETLCDQLLEHAVAVTPAEYTGLYTLMLEIRADIGRLTPLRA